MYNFFILKSVTFECNILRIIEDNIKFLNEFFQISYIKKLKNNVKKDT